LSSLFKKRHAQRPSLGYQTVRILEPGQFVQPRMERHKTLLQPQDRNQLLAHHREPICLPQSALKLKDHQSVAAQNQGD
jgi:hypothetical protein